MSDPLVGLCIGHSRQVNGRTEGGAESITGTQEHAYNSALAIDIKRELSDLGVQSFIVSKYQGNGYTAAQRWLASELKSRGATIALELHFNSSDNDDATGHEWLYWKTSAKGENLAACLNIAHFEMFPELKMRGIKALGNSDRGAEFLKLTSMPAVICEPFFGSNLSDWNHADSAQALIAQAIAVGITAYLHP